MKQIAYVPLRNGFTRLSSSTRINFFESAYTQQFTRGDTYFGTNAKIPVIVAGTIKLSNIKIKQIAYVPLRNGFNRL